MKLTVIAGKPLSRRDGLALESALNVATGSDITQEAFAHAYTIQHSSNITELRRERRKIGTFCNLLYTCPCTPLPPRDQRDQGEKKRQTERGSLSITSSPPQLLFFLSALVGSGNKKDGRRADKGDTERSCNCRQQPRSFGGAKIPTNWAERSVVWKRVISIYRELSIGNKTEAEPLAIYIHGRCEEKPQESFWSDAKNSLMRQQAGPVKKEAGQQKKEREKTDDVGLFL